MYLSGNIQRPNSLLLEHCKELGDVDGGVLEYLKQTTKEQGEEQIKQKEEEHEQTQNANSLGYFIEQKIILMIQPIENSVSLKKSQGKTNRKLELLVGSVVFAVFIMAILVYAQTKLPSKYLSISTVVAIVISIICAFLGIASLLSSRISQRLCNLFLRLISRCLISPSEFQILEKDIHELHENTRRIIKKAIQLIRDSELLLNRLRIGTPSQVIIRLQEALSDNDRPKDEHGKDKNIMQQLGDYRQIRGIFEISCMELRQTLADELEKYSSICLEVLKKNNPKRQLLVNLCQNNGISTEQLKSQANAFADLVGLLQTMYEKEITQTNLFRYLKKLKNIQSGAIHFRVSLKEGLKKQKLCLFQEKEKKNAEEQQIDGNMNAQILTLFEGLEKEFKQKGLNLGNESNEGQVKEMESLDQKQEFWVKHWKRIQEEFGEESRKYKVILSRLGACKDIQEKDILRQQLDSQMMKVQSLHEKAAEIFVESRDDKKKLKQRSCLDENCEYGQDNQRAESDDCELDMSNNEKEQTQEDDKETVSVLEANAFDGCNWEHDANRLQKQLNQPQFLSEMRQVLEAKNPQKKEKRIILDTPEERQMNLRRRNQQNAESSEDGRMKFFQENSQKSLFAELKGVAFSRSSGLGEEILE